MSGHKTQFVLDAFKPPFFSSKCFVAWIASFSQLEFSHFVLALVMI